MYDTVEKSRFESFNSSFFLKQLRKQVSHLKIQEGEVGERMRLDRIKNEREKIDKDNYYLTDLLSVVFLSVSAITREVRLTPNFLYFSFLESDK